MDHYCSVVPEKSQLSGPLLSEKLLTVTASPRVGIFLSPLNTNDGFYLSHIPPTNKCEGKKGTVARR